MFSMQSQTQVLRFAQDDKTERSCTKSMKTSRCRFSASALVGMVLPALLTACGGNSAHQLESITVSPSSATVAGSNGTIQFEATGHFKESPATETPFTTNWSYTGPEGEKIGLTEDGMATCKAGQPGTFTVAAWVQPDANGPVCNVIGPGGAPCPSVAGTAQLICP